MPVFAMALLSLLALRAVKVLGEGMPPKSSDFYASEETLNAVKSFAEINRDKFGDLSDPLVFAEIEVGLLEYLLTPDSGCKLTEAELRDKV